MGPFFPGLRLRVLTGPEIIASAAAWQLATMPMPVPSTRKRSPASTALAKPLLADAGDPAVRVLRSFRLDFNAVKTHFQHVEKMAGVNAFAAAVDVHQTTASNLVKALMAAEMLVAESEGVDKRAVQLPVLPAGEPVLSKAPGPFAGLLPEALSALDAARWNVWTPTSRCSSTPCAPMRAQQVFRWRRCDPALRRASRSAPNCWFRIVQMHLNSRQKIRRPLLMIIACLAMADIASAACLGKLWQHHSTTVEAPAISVNALNRPSADAVHEPASAAGAPNARCPGVDA